MPQPDLEQLHRPVNKRLVLYAALMRLHDEESARDLVCNLWHYTPAVKQLPLETWSPAEQDLMNDDTPVQVLANHNGFQVVLFHMKSSRHYLAEQRRLIERLYLKYPAWHGLFLFSNENGKEWHLVNVKGRGTETGLVVRRLRITENTPLHNIVKRLVKIDIQEIGLEASAGKIQEVHDQVFDVQDLTDEFFSQYKLVFEEVRSSLQGFGEEIWNDRNLFTQTLFNRLMFIAFIQKKGWLTLNGSQDYLAALWADYMTSRSKDGNFYSDRLKKLYFSGLNMPVDRRPVLDNLIGEVPYLNGGLFASDILDKLPEITVPDESIQAILFNLFARFDFTVSESTELDQNVAVDPEMLGRVFEELVVGREEQGSYYTPKSVVTYMCREALKKYLKGRVPDENDEAIGEFVDRHDLSALQYRQEISDSVRNAKVCDPACGSGAYLLGMLHELLDLGLCLFNQQALAPNVAYRRKLEIIQNNLYGVDLDQFAVNIARLRLWLSLAVEYDAGDPPPMPNLDFKIEQGNSLTAPDPSPSANPTIFRAETINLVDRLQRSFIIATAETRANLLGEIEEEIKKLKLGDEVLPPEAFDWRIQFANIFMAGGFDIILANPPYVKAGKFRDDKKVLEKVYKEVYTGSADLYIYFYYRAIQLLKPNGVLAFISSNKWVQSDYGLKLRKEMEKRTQITEIVNFGDLPVFRNAVAFPMIIVAQKGSSSSQQVRLTLVPSLDPPYPEIRKVVDKYGEPLNPKAISKGRWLLGSNESINIVFQMESAKFRLGKYTGVHFYSGIKTGFNKAYIINGSKRAELIAADPKSDELLKPMVTGENIKRWRIPPVDKWLIFTPNDLDQSKLSLPPIKIEQYPAIHKHLQQYKDKLEKRGDRGPKRWQLRSCGYYPVFHQKKIMYQEIATYPRFAFDDSGLYCNNKVFVIPCDDLFLLGILNSKWVWTYLKITCSQLQNQTISLQTPYLFNLPIPNASEEDKRIIIALVQKCLNVNTKGLKEIEAEIDERVGRLYGIL